MDLESVIQSEVSLKEKNKYRMSLGFVKYRGGSERQFRNRQRRKMVMDWDLRQVVE